MDEDNSSPLPLGMYIFAPLLYSCREIVVKEIRHPIIYPNAEDLILF